MTFPSRQNPVRLIRTRRLSLKDKGDSQRLVLECQTECWIRQHHPESSALAGERACDWLVEVRGGKRDDAATIEQIYVELKSRNHLEKAVKQLRATIERFDPALTTWRKRSYAVGHFTKPAQLRVRKEDKEFQKKYRSRFEVVRGDLPVPLQRVASLIG